MGAPGCQWQAVPARAGAPAKPEPRGVQGSAHLRGAGAGRRSALRPARAEGAAEPRAGAQNTHPAAPRSVPARKKAQAAPPQPPLPLPALGEELPWGDVTLNKCLVLASLVALLGSAFQLCHGEPGSPEVGWGLGTRTPAPQGRAKHGQGGVWVPPLQGRGSCRPLSCAPPLSSPSDPGRGPLSPPPPAKATLTPASWPGLPLPAPASGTLWPRRDLREKKDSGAFATGQREVRDRSALSAESPARGTARLLCCRGMEL